MMLVLEPNILNVIDEYSIVLQNVQIFLLNKINMELQ